MNIVVCVKAVPSTTEVKMDPKTNTIVRDGRACVECSKASRINFIAGGDVGDGITVMGSPFEDELTGGEYKLKGRETYVRAECVDKYGRKAWTNPIFLK